MALPTTQIRITKEAAARLKAYAGRQPESAPALASRWITERIEAEERATEERRAEQARKRRERMSG